MVSNYQPAHPYNVALLGAALNATPVETAKTVEALREIKCR